MSAPNQHGTGCLSAEALSNPPPASSGARHSWRTVLSVLFLVFICTVHPDARGGTAMMQARPAHYLIGLSPFLDKAAKNEVYRQIVRLVIQDLPLNSSLAVYDAYHLSTVAAIRVPDVHAFESSRTRVNQFKDALMATRRFLAEDHPAAEVAGMKFDQAVRLPQFLRFIGDNRVETNEPVVVIVLGSPLYLDEKETSFSMVDGYFPSDGHLLAGRERSVYGVKGSEHALQGVDVYFGYFGDPWINDLQREKVGRFWSLYVRMQGGRLATFSGDLPTVLQAARLGAEPAGNQDAPFAVDPAQTKIEMVRVSREIDQTEWITGDLPADVQTRPPSMTVGPMKIGIRWKGNIDLDIYARPTAGAETLFFQHTRSEAGYYYKDHRSSPDREYEFVEFLSPVDISKVEAAVNFYQGQVPTGPSGEVRVEFDGRIYSGHFSIESRHGNQGRGGDDQSAYWATIDIPKLLHLPLLARREDRGSGHDTEH